MAYAENTSVSVSKTKGEIDGLLRKTRAVLVFETAARRIVFHLPLPNMDEKRFTMTARGQRRSADAAMAAWEQACRSRWRSLFLCIKAKLESVEAGIETFEDSFLAHIQMPDGHTVAEHVRPRIASAYAGEPMQPLLPAPRSAD